MLCRKACLCVYIVSKHEDVPHKTPSGSPPLLNHLRHAERRGVNIPLRQCQCLHVTKDIIPPPNKASKVTFHVVSQCVLVCVSSAGLSLKGAGRTTIDCHSQTTDSAYTEKHIVLTSNKARPVTFCVVSQSMLVCVYLLKTRRCTSQDTE